MKDANSNIIAVNYGCTLTKSQQVCKRSAIANDIEISNAKKTEKNHVNITKHRRDRNVN